MGLQNAGFIGLKEQMQTIMSPLYLLILEAKSCYLDSNLYS